MRLSICLYHGLLLSLLSIQFRSNAFIPSCSGQNHKRSGHGTPMMYYEYHRPLQKRTAHVRNFTASNHKTNKYVCWRNKYSWRWYTPKVVCHEHERTTGFEWCIHRRKPGRYARSCRYKETRHDSTVRRINLTSHMRWIVKLPRKKGFTEYLDVVIKVGGHNRRDKWTDEYFKKLRRDIHQCKLNEFSMLSVYQKS